MDDIDLRGVKNARDLGGMRAVGGVIRPKMLLRSGHLGKLTRRDIELLHDEYHLRLVIDLRTVEERAEKPDIEVPGAVNQSIPLFDRAAIGVTHEEASDNLTAVLSKLPELSDLYRSMLQGSSLQHLAEAVGLITEFAGEEGAVLFHCTEGKDRAGLVAFILLWILGVPYAGITEDYLKTNEVMRARARRLYWTVRLFKRDKIAARKVERLMLADESCLDAIIDEANERFGSMDRFITEGLQLSAKQQQDFRDRVLC